MIKSFTRQLTPSPTQVDEWVRFKQQQARKYLTTRIITYDDAGCALAALARGKVRLALGTGASRDTTDLILKRLGLFDFFSIILTAGDVQNGKPAPEEFMRQLRRKNILQDVKVLAARLEGVDRAQMRYLADSLRNKLQSCVVVLSSAEDGNVSIVSAVTKDLTSRVHAGKLIVHLHGPRCCHSETQNNSNFRPRESSPVCRCDTTAIRSPMPVVAHC